MEKFQKFVKGMDDNVKNLIGVFHDNRKRHTGREYHVTKVYYLEHKQYVWSYVLNKYLYVNNYSSFSFFLKGEGEENQFIFTVLIR